MMKPILHLLGDRYKAAQFLPFANRKLAEMKQLMKRQRLKMQNRLIRFTTDSVEVYIESYRGMDKIRITAAAAVEEAGISGDSAFILPSMVGSAISKEGLTIIMPGITTRASDTPFATFTITFDITPNVWNDNGDILIAGSTSRYTLVNISSPSLLLPISGRTLSANTPYYYGILIEYVSHTGDSSASIGWTFVGTADPGWETYYLSGGVWGTIPNEDERSPSIQWRNPYRPQGEPVISYANTGASPGFSATANSKILCSSSVTSIVVAKKLFSTTIITFGANPTSWVGHEIGKYLEAPHGFPGP